jgi:hypothetical protein
VVIASYTPLLDLRRRIENVGDWEICFDVLVAGPGVTSIEEIVSTPYLMDDIVSSVANTMTEWGIPVSVTEKVDVEHSSSRSRSITFIIALSVCNLAVIILLLSIYFKFSRKKVTNNTERQTTDTELTAGAVFEESDSDVEFEEIPAGAAGSSQLTRGTSFIQRRIQSGLDQLIPGEWTHADGIVKIRKNGELSYIVKDGGQSFSTKVNQQGKFKVLYRGRSISAKIKENTMIWDGGSKWHRVSKERRTNQPSGRKNLPKRRLKKTIISPDDGHTIELKYQEVPKSVKVEALDHNLKQEEVIFTGGDDDECSSSSVLYMTKQSSAKGKYSSPLKVLSGSAKSNCRVQKRDQGDPGLIDTESSETVDSCSDVKLLGNSEIKSRDRDCVVDLV